MAPPRIWAPAAEQTKVAANIVEMIWKGLIILRPLTLQMPERTPRLQ
jgi:hypothetical protein